MIRTAEGLITSSKHRHFSAVNEITPRITQGTAITPRKKTEAAAKWLSLLHLVSYGARMRYNLLRNTSNSYGNNPPVAALRNNTNNVLLRFTLFSICATIISGKTSSEPVNSCFINTLVNCEQSAITWRIKNSQKKSVSAAARSFDSDLVMAFDSVNGLFRTLPTYFSPPASEATLWNNEPSAQE